MKTKHLSWMLPASLLLLGATAAAGESAHPVDRLKPGHWLEVPDSQLIKVAFKWPKGVTYTKNGVGFKGIISCWSGGAYDARRDRLLIWGGGHFAYGGNEIYGFGVRELKWERLSDPSLKTDLKHTAGGEAYPDGTPRSCHSCGYIQYVPTIDRFCSFGTGSTFPGDRGGGTTWAFDFERKTWKAMAKTSWGGGMSTASAWDPVRRRMWFRAGHSKAYIAEWIPEKDEWVRHKRVWPKMLKKTGAGVLDPVRRRFYSAGGGLLLRFRIEGPGAYKEERAKTTGPQELVKASNPGLQYDPVADKLVGWAGGTELYVLDPDKDEWKKVAPAKSNKVKPTPPCGTGTYGRFRYVPSKNAYVVVNDVKQNVFFYRLTDRAKQPIPKRFLAALKGKDAALVKWVAGQVAKWPKAKAEPVLKAALAQQKAAGAAAIVKALEAALKKLEGEK